MEIRKAIISCLERDLDYITDTLQEIIKNPHDVSLEEMTSEFQRAKRHRIALNTLKNNEPIRRALSFLEATEVDNIFGGMEDIE